MDLDAVKRSLEPASGGETLSRARFFETFVLYGLSIDLIEHGHVICSMKVPPRLLNSSGLLHGGLMVALVDVVGSAVFYSAGLPTSGVSLEISISYVDAAYINDEIEFDAKILKTGKTVIVSTVEIRKKKTGKIVAQARHAKYAVASSKL
ncbi:LOW QUALITY PROTEIN: acyl-coenzyme A thioesterase 13-like [Phalaenopsis equestris]|uniref:LOW QUALITY PROTEIN: acyl-coenzyme A thioesterase 13-like n=1 Tax=Phalaenopsis equestris TaxID=78828 RepID=UPI0009E6189C|nr:LOW QUALITY PROTEIN: acyl-coenzyme A thioesterase 13-like [Phalaenopsis equestris]